MLKIQFRVYIESSNIGQSINSVMLTHSCILRYHTLKEHSKYIHVCVSTCISATYAISGASGTHLAMVIATLETSS